MTARELTIAGMIAGAVLAAHGGAIDGGFHYDDRVSVQENLAIRSWQPIAYLTSPYAASSEPGSAGFRPLTVATLALNYQVHGLDPSGYLLVNILLHAGASWLVFLIGRRLLGDDRWAALAGLLYAVHPVNAEAVNYVIARSSLLAVCGTLTACWAFLRRVGGGGPAYTVIGVSAFLLALLSKESAAAFIVPLAAYLWFFGNDRAGADRISARIRNLGAAAPYALVLIGYLGWWWTVAGSVMENRGRAAAYPLFAFLEMVGRSLGLWVWPWPLGLDHPVTFAGRFDGVLALVLVVVLALSAVTGWVLRRHRPLVSWCLVWVFAGFAPFAPLPWLTIKGLLQEHRLAVVGAALAWLTVWGVREAARVVDRTLLQRGMARLRPVLAGVAVAGAVGAGLGAIAVDRARSAVWGDDVRLWEEVARRSPDNRGAYINLGGSYMARGLYDRAEEAFRRALVLTPDDAQPYYALGVLAFRRERYDDAERLLIRTIELAPDYAPSYQVLGAMAMRRGLDQAAGALFRRAAALDTRNAETRSRLGLLAQRSGDDRSAEEFYRQAIALDPGHALARNNLGTLYMQREQWPAALDQFVALLDRRPDDHEAAFNRAAALDALGRGPEAKVALDALLARLPADSTFDGYRRGAAFILDRGPGGGGAE